LVLEKIRVCIIKLGLVIDGIHLKLAGNDLMESSATISNCEDGEKTIELI
jgi:hypothetical protein